MPTTAKSRPTGRPTKLTPDVGLGLLATLSAGYSRAEAARVARIDPGTLKRWLRRGRRDLNGGQNTDHAALAELVTDVERRAGWR